MAIASNRYNLQMARQAARGVYPTEPTFFFECQGTGLQPRPTISSLNITDGRLWVPSRKRVTYIETGGQPELVAQPGGLGALLYGMLGAITSVPGTPNVHTITPADDLGSFPFWTIWEYFDGQWRLYKDCQIIGGQITVGVDNTWAIVRPNIVGLAPVEYIDKPATEAIEESEDVHWLDGGGYHFIGGDPENALHVDVPADLDGVKTYLASYKTAWNAHCAVSSGVHHKAADTTNTLTYTAPIADEAAAVAACSEIRSKLLAHYADETVHYFADTANVITHAAPTDTASCITFIQELQGAVNSPGCYNRHLGAKAGARTFTLNIDMSAAPLQGEAVVPYTVKRKRGSVTCAMDVLQEDFELINLAIFGNPNPDAGTTQTTEIQRLSMYNKFISQASPEYSLAVSIPQFDFDPEPIFGITASPEGNEIVLSIGGEASGSDPVVTIELKNGVEEY